MSIQHTLPENLRVYAIGDIHGYAERLDDMHTAISADLIDTPPPGEVHIVYIGDYIDRGPDSAGVIERLIARRDRGDGIPKTFILGNHEAGMLSFMDDPVGHDWLRFGGIETLASYGITFEGGLVLPGEVEMLPGRMAQLVPKAHIEFLKELTLSLQLGDYVFAHAGIDPRKPLEEQTQEDFTYMREPFLSWDAPMPGNVRVVHGHTPCTAPEVLPHRICVDTGIYEGGAFTAAVLDGPQVRFLKV